MSETIPIGTREPSLIAAGDNVSWTRQIDNFPAGTWTLHYVLRNQQNIYTFAATASGSLHSVTLTTATTGTWEPGIYAVGAYVVTGSQQVQVRTAFGTVEITENLASKPNGVDTRTFAERSLANIEATIESLTKRKVETAQVNGQAYTLANLNDLWKLRERFASEVRREEQQARLNAGLGAGNKIGVRFRPLNPKAWPPNQQVPWQ